MKKIYVVITDQKSNEYGDEYNIKAFKNYDKALLYYNEEVENILKTISNVREHYMIKRHKHLFITYSPIEYDKENMSVSLHPLEVFI
jgi:hypothetical protein